MIKEIVVAGGCFWGVEEYYQRLKGVVDTKAGYAQGDHPHPTYEIVCKGDSNYAEVVKVFYDSNIINLKTILEHLFRIIDPTTLNRQGNDIGVQYRTGIYYSDPNDKIIIDAFLNEKQKHYSKKIVVESKPLTTFYLAEEYHQKYLQKKPSGYCHVDFSKINSAELK